MSQLDEFADNIDDIVAGHNKRFAALNDAKRKLQADGDAIAQSWEDYFVSEAKKLQAAKAALSRISNAPLSATPAGVPVNSPLSAVPTLVKTGG